MRLLLLILTSFILASCSESGNSSNGNEGPGGGDTVAQKAASMAEEIFTIVRTSPSVYPEVSIDEFRKAIDRARIIVREKTYANGVETDAVNNGFDLIELNRSRWNSISDHDKKLALLFHELLGLIGLEKDNYFISNRLLSIKNRYFQRRTYSCFSQENVCEVEMVYSPSLKSFLVFDRSCGEFPENPMTQYRRFSDVIYSTRRHCWEDEETGTGGCSVRSGSGDEWDEVTFLEGYNFYFTGLVDKQLHCNFTE